MKSSRRKTTRSKIAEEADESTTRKPKGHSRVGKGGIPQLNPFVEMLKEATVEQAVPSRRVVVLDDTNTVAETLKVQAQTIYLRHKPVFCIKLLYSNTQYAY